MLSARLAIPILTVCLASSAIADQTPPVSDPVRISIAQNATIGLIADGPGSTDTRIAADLARALDSALARTPEHGELVCLPTYTAMLALRQIVTERGHVRPYWERAA